MRQHPDRASALSACHTAAIKTPKICIHKPAQPPQRPAPYHSTEHIVPECHILLILQAKLITLESSVLAQDVILVGDQKGYDTYYTANTCNTQLGTALPDQRVLNYRIRPRPRPCRQQQQDHMTRSVPRALRRIQAAKEATRAILPSATKMTQAVPGQPEIGCQINLVHRWLQAKTR